jgi:hypothetical protein
MMRATLVVVAFALTACGGTNPGWGSQTLFVNARLSSDGSTDGTSARVEVRQGSPTGAVVPDATVTLRGDRLASRTLTFRANAGNGGAYVTDGFAWDTNFVLDVKHGDDTLVGSLDPPGASIITAPIAGTTFRRANAIALTIEWKDDIGRRADSTQLTLEKAKVDRRWSNGAEPFHVEIEPSALVATDRERINLERTSEVKLAGGTAGSVLRATTSHRIEFTVE